MAKETARRRARELARECAERGDPLGWFERVYSEAGGDPEGVQWADLAPNPHLVAWRESRDPRGPGRRALVVGSGLGDDAEYLAGLGLATVGFDLAPTGIAWCRRRFPYSAVDYRVADLFALPAEWRGAFDLVVEVYTLQVLPPEPRPAALAAIAGCVAEGGTLLVVARGRDESDAPGLGPWPLTRAELDALVRLGLREVDFADFPDEEEPPVRRFRAEYRRD